MASILQHKKSIKKGNDLDFIKFSLCYYAARLGAGGAIVNFMLLQNSYKA
jgi:hypothetical protein